MPKTSLRKRVKRPKRHREQEKWATRQKNEPGTAVDSPEPTDSVFIHPSSSRSSDRPSTSHESVLSPESLTKEMWPPTPDIEDRPSSALSSSSSMSLPPTPQPLYSSDESNAFEPVSSAMSNRSSAMTPKLEDTNETISSMEQTNLLLNLRNMLLILLPSDWTAVVSSSGVHVLMLSRKDTKCVQRSVLFKPSGEFTVFVHKKCLPSDKFMKNVRDIKILRNDTITYFADRICDVVSNVRKYEICAGVDNPEYRQVWKYFENCEVDRNPYDECRYESTLRSSKCFRLVLHRTWSCVQCAKLGESVKRKAKAAETADAPLTSPNTFLTDDQIQLKLKKQQMKLDSNRKVVEYHKMKEMIKKESVPIPTDLAEDISGILKNANLNPTQSLFLQQQLKSASKRKTANRWHPNLIRLALAIHMASPAAYRIARDSGMIKLPHERTLFDYSHLKPTTDGIDMDTIIATARKVHDMTRDGCEYKKYHVLMFDEIYISKSLVYQKNSGNVIGYEKLGKVEEEMALLEKSLNRQPGNTLVEPASKVLTYMLKGTANGIKEVVAAFPVCCLTKEKLYKWTWRVVGRLEGANLPVTALVCDGSPVNRAFFKMHKPAAQCDENIVYCTINKAAPERKLFFFADVPHLLKTTRNCFANSGKKRHLKKNGQSILWKTIIQLYSKYKDNVLRKAFKLNAQNVFLNSYSCMNVAYAAQVMSLTVAKALQDENWPGTQETVTFITWINNVFDMLNGAHSMAGIKDLKPNLYPYRTHNDSRFEELIKFLEYLHEWKIDADSAGKTLNKSTAEGNVDDPALSFQSVEEEPEDEFTPAKKRQLAQQTIEGFQITIHSFIDCTRFLLEEGTKYINARIFSQDPLEHYFSIQRSKCGGSTNPTLQQFLQSKNAIEIEGHLGVRRRGSNVQSGEAGMKLSDQPLQKRKRYTKKVND